MKIDAERLAQRLAETMAKHIKPMQEQLRAAERRIAELENAEAQRTMKAMLHGDSHDAG